MKLQMIARKEKHKEGFELGRLVVEVDFVKVLTLVTARGRGVTVVVIVVAMGRGVGDRCCQGQSC